MGILFKYIATLGFIGYICFAPGTFGTLSAFVVYILLKPTDFWLIVMLLIFVPLGTISAGYTERLLNEKDSKHIVIDEFCGYFCSVLFLPQSMNYLIAAFFLFRIFDILKPFPIRRIELILKGGTGVMADDLAAALYTNAILQIWRML